jgi:hypothetical protein
MTITEERMHRLSKRLAAHYKRISEGWRIVAMYYLIETEPGSEFKCLSRLEMMVFKNAAK